jgi:predicted nucleic acid-binding protein
MTLSVALDTKALVRLLVNDDPDQADVAAALIDASSACFVLITAAVERWRLRLLQRR